MAKKHTKLEILGEIFYLVPATDYEQLPGLNKTSLGQRIRAARAKKNLSQVAFAKLLRTTPAQISRWEQGQKAQAKTERKILDVISKIEKWMLVIAVSKDF